jgi:hypothetical protein
VAGGGICRSTVADVSGVARMSLDMTAPASREPKNGIGASPVPRSGCTDRTRAASHRAASWEVWCGLLSSDGVRQVNLAVATGGVQGAVGYPRAYARGHRKVRPDGGVVCRFRGFGEADIVCESPAHGARRFACAHPAGQAWCVHAEPALNRVTSRISRPSGRHLLTSKDTPD